MCSLGYTWHITVVMNPIKVGKVTPIMVRNQSRAVEMHIQVVMESCSGQLAVHVKIWVMLCIINYGSRHTPVDSGTHKLHQTTNYQIINQFMKPQKTATRVLENTHQ